VVRQAVERLRAGRSSTPRASGPRPKGFARSSAALRIALWAGCDILPVLIRAPRALMQGERCTDCPLENPVFRIEVGEPIRPSLSVGGEARALAARRLTAVLEEHLEKR